MTLQSIDTAPLNKKPILGYNMRDKTFAVIQYKCTREQSNPIYNQDGRVVSWSEDVPTHIFELTEVGEFNSDYVSYDDRWYEDGDYSVESEWVATHWQELPLFES